MLLVYYQISRFDDIQIFFLDISMMFNKIIIQWFWVDGTTKPEIICSCVTKFAQNVCSRDLAEISQSLLKPILPLLWNNNYKKDMSM